MEEYNINSVIKKYSKSKPLRFHMPGHKGNKEFKKIFKGAGEDITELAFSDSLSSPSGVIKKAEENVAEILGVKKSWFLVDGSTSGIYAMLYAVKDYGNKIIINRNAHQSVYNACKIFGIEPIILKQNTNEDIILPPKVDDIENAILSNQNVIGLLLTYPDYYGQVFDMENTYSLTRKYNKLLLIDGAHGAHLRFFPKPEYAGKFADIYVDGVHKTLPCLTQTAVLNTNSQELAEKISSIINMFRTTSPNYLLMDSIEYGENFMNKKGGKLLAELSMQVALLKNRLASKGIKVLQTDDFTKFSLDCKSIGVSSDLAEKYFNKCNIFIEMNDGRYLLFLLSALNTPKELFRLEKVIYRLKRNKKLRSTYNYSKKVTIGKKRISYIEALSSKNELIELSDSNERISAENVGLFPPCFPLLIAGEEINQEIIGILQNSEFTYGLNNGKIKVIK